MYSQLKRKFGKRRSNDVVRPVPAPQKPAPTPTPEMELALLSGELDEAQRQIVHITTDRLRYQAGDIVYITVTVLHHFTFAPLPRKQVSDSHSDSLLPQRGSDGSRSESVIRAVTLEVFQLPTDPNDVAAEVPVWKGTLSAKEASSTIAAQWQATPMPDASDVVSKGSHFDGRKLRAACKAYRLLVSFPLNVGFPSADCTVAVLPPLSLYKLLQLPLYGSPEETPKKQLYCAVVGTGSCDLARLQGGHAELTVAVCDHELLAVSGALVQANVMAVMAAKDDGEANEVCVREETVKTRLGGFCEIKFDLPPCSLLHADYVKVKCTIVAEQGSETCSLDLPVVDDLDVVLQFVPESTAELLDSLPNKLYVSSALRSNRAPVGIVAELVILRGKEGDKIDCVVETGKNGHGSFWVTPQGDYEVEARVRAVNGVFLPPSFVSSHKISIPIVSNGVQLNCWQPCIGSDCILRVAVLSTLFRDPVPVEVAVYKREKKVAGKKLEITTALEQCELLVPAVVDGTLRVCLLGNCDSKTQLLAERLVFKQPCRMLNIAVHSKEDLRFAIGPLVQFTASVTDHNGQPVPNATLTATVLASYAEREDAGVHPLGLKEGCYLQPEVQHEIYGGDVDISRVGDVDRILCFQMWRKFGIDNLRTLVSRFPLEAERAYAFHPAQDIAPPQEPQPAMILYGAVTLDGQLILSVDAVVQCNDLAGLHVSSLVPKLLLKIAGGSSDQSNCLSYELENANLHLLIRGRLAFLCLTERQVKRATAAALLAAVEEKFMATLWPDIARKEQSFGYERETLLDGLDTKWFEKFLKDAAVSYSVDPSHDKVLQMKRELQLLRKHVLMLSQAARTRDEGVERLAVQQEEVRIAAQKYMEYTRSFSQRVKGFLFGEEAPELPPSPSHQRRQSGGLTDSTVEHDAVMLSSIYSILPETPAVGAKILDNKDQDLLLFNVRKHVNYAGSEPSDAPPRVLFYASGLKTDKNGNVTFQFEFDRTVSSFVVQADAHGVVPLEAHGDKHLGAVGSMRMVIDSKDVFHVDVQLPQKTQFMSGNRLSIPVQITNGTNLPRSLRMEFFVTAARGQEPPLVLDGFLNSSHSQGYQTTASGADVIPGFTCETRLLQAAVMATSPEEVSCDVTMVAHHSARTLIETYKINVRPAGICCGFVASHMVTPVAPAPPGTEDSPRMRRQLADSTSPVRSLSKESSLPKEAFCGTTVLHRSIPTSELLTTSTDVLITVSVAADPSPIIQRWYSVVARCPSDVFGFCWSSLVLAGLLLDHVTGSKLKNLGTHSVSIYKEATAYQAKLREFVNPETSKLALYVGSVRLDATNTVVRTAQVLHAIVDLRRLLDSGSLLQELYPAIVRDLTIMVSTRADPVATAYCLFIASSIYYSRALAELMQHLEMTFVQCDNPYYLAIMGQLYRLITKDAPGESSTANRYATALAALQEDNGYVRNSSSSIVARDMQPLSQEDIILENVAVAVQCWCQVGLDKFGVHARKGIEFMLSGHLDASCNPAVIAFSCKALHLYWVCRMKSQVRSAPPTGVQMRINGHLLNSNDVIRRANELTGNVMLETRISQSFLKQLAETNRSTLDVTVTVLDHRDACTLFGCVLGKWYCWAAPQLAPPTLEPNHALSRPHSLEETLDFLLDVSATPSCIPVGGCATVSARIGKKSPEGHPFAMSLFIPANMVPVLQGDHLSNSVKEQTQASFVRFDASCNRLWILFSHETAAEQHFTLECRALLPGMCQGSASFVCYLANFLASLKGNVDNRRLTFARPVLMSVLPEHLRTSQPPATADESLC